MAIATLAAVGFYAYNLGVAHGLAQSGHALATPRSGTALCLLATSVGIRLRILPVLSPAVHPVFRVCSAWAILAWMGRPTMGALARRRATRF